MRLISAPLGAPLSGRRTCTRGWRASTSPKVQLATPRKWSAPRGGGLPPLNSQSLVQIKIKDVPASLFPRTREDETLKPSRFLILGCTPAHLSVYLQPRNIPVMSGGGGEGAHLQPCWRPVNILFSGSSIFHDIGHLTLRPFCLYTLGCIFNQMIPTPRSVWTNLPSSGSPIFRRCQLYSWTQRPAADPPPRQQAGPLGCWPGSYLWGSCDQPMGSLMAPWGTRWG